jgi:poly-gamma-glutamate biosynthesis protein PgsC/CapC
MLPQAIGLGLVVSLIFSETLGLAASGMVVPGYIAMNLHSWQTVLGTFVAGIITMVIIRAIGRVILLYGRRTLVLSVVIGFIMAYAIPAILNSYLFTKQLGLGSLLPEFDVIGYIIAGLLGYWMVRQGILETICTVLAASIVVRLILTVVHGGWLG